MAHKDIKDYSYEELQAALDKKRQGEVDSKKEELKKARAEVTKLEADLERLTGKSVTKAFRSPRGSTKEGILSYLTNNPGDQAIKDIIRTTGLVAGSVNQAVNNLVKAGTIKKGSKRGHYTI